MQSEDDIGKGVVRIRSWAEFKRLVESFKPKAIVYNIEQNGLSPKREFNQSKVYIAHWSAYYVFLDFAEGERLKETGIQLRRTIRGLFLEEEDVVIFLRRQFKRDDLLICSYWTI